MTERFVQSRRVLLLAEDDTEMRLLLSLALQKDGWSVIECKDGMDLLMQIQPLLDGDNELEYDLIITDIRMPGVTGMDVVEGLTDLADHPPIILITAFGDARIHGRARQLGAAAILDKPFEIDELLSAVHGVFGDPDAAEGKAVVRGAHEGRNRTVTAEARTKRRRQQVEGPHCHE